MKPYIVPKRHLVGRKIESKSLKKIASASESSIIIMYGRRRIGKTELLEQTFRKRNVLKFEGIEGLAEKEQLNNVIVQFADYSENRHYRNLKIDSWTGFLKLVAEYTAHGTWTIYLEELQWLANYKSNLIAELKYVWDNFFRYNPNLIVILCGSSPSFMLDQVVHSRALYNRSQYEFYLKAFTLIETREYLLKRSRREVIDAYLTIGGIPEYLKWVDKESSVFLSLCHHSFVANSFFSNEYEKIFTSSMAKNSHYKKVVDFLSRKKFATRQELAQYLDTSTGGALTSLLTDLEKSGFIDTYHPFNTKSVTTLTRYCIADNYLQFYFKFIKPIRKKIDNGDFNSNPSQAINRESYAKWLGFAFERWCRQYHRIIANILGFSAVEYTAGPYFSKRTEKQSPGFQIDLVFDRADQVYTICEVKYLRSAVGTRVIAEFEKKLDLFPGREKRTIQKVLICNEGADSALEERAYFDRIITLEELFESFYWR